MEDEFLAGEVQEKKHSRAHMIVNSVESRLFVVLSGALLVFCILCILGAF